jgi:uncharacterized protein YjbI with pentapeptide repeats
VTGRWQSVSGWDRRWLWQVAALAAAAAGVVVTVWPDAAGRVVAQAGRWLATLWPALILLLMAVMLWRRAAGPPNQAPAEHQGEPRREPPGEGTDPPRWPWLVSDRGVLSVAVGVALVGVAALAVMWQIAALVPQDVDRRKLQIEAIKYGLGFFAAAGAAAALLLAVRRQQLAEHTHRLELRKHTHTEVDAAARRVTELYTKAVEQLGSGDAAVRLGGLRALERVAQDNPEQRQTVVDVLCAYLRMPFTAPTTSDTTPPAARPTELPLGSLPAAAPGGRDAHQELQVRLTAQRILTPHLRRVAPGAPGGATPWPQQPRFWADMDLDLTSAVLVDCDLSGSDIHNGIFSKATFLGTADFCGANFDGTADFDGATFSDAADFGHATFHGTADFDEATFSDAADFGHATFHGTADFDEATFSDTAHFGEATFSDAASFHHATFTDMTHFREATFDGAAEFGEATFSDAADFGQVTFDGTADFGRATFDGTAAFREATFSDTGNFGGTAFTHMTVFDKATFSDTAKFRRAAFFGDAHFEGAAFSGPALFGEATFDHTADFGKATFSDTAHFGEASFSGAANFRKATFDGTAHFGEAAFDGAADFGEAHFSDMALFGGATFNGSPHFDAAIFTKNPAFGGAIVQSSESRIQEWPAGQRLTGEGRRLTHTTEHAGEGSARGPQIPSVPSGED